MEKCIFTMHDEQQNYDFGIERLAGMGIEAVWEKDTVRSSRDEDFVISYCKDFDYAMVGGEIYNARVLANCPKMKLIIRFGAGYDSLDLEAATDAGVALINLPGANSVAVAEHAVGLILASSRRIPQMSNRIHAGQYIGTSCTTHQVSGKTVGVIGCGNIGKNVVRMLSGFGCNFLVYDVVQDEAFAKMYSVRYTSLDEVLSQSDIITLHPPATPQTNGLICTETIAKMKDGVLLVNTSRGSVVKSQDLLEALNSGKVAAAGLDALQGEGHGIPDVPELMVHPNTVVTPHSASATYETYYAMMHRAIDMIDLFRKGDPMPGLLNPDYIKNARYKV